MANLFRGLSNADIRWQGTRAGLVPQLVDEKAKAFADVGEGAIPELLELLSDEQSFVAAHLLLTGISGVSYRSYPDWNGLEVDIAPDGTAIVDAAQRTVLARRWKQWYDSRPRPAMLPEAD